jgi:uracil-DNA glycosylase family 4
MTIEVPAVGPIDAEIILIGEAPAAEEVRKMRPFSGSAGQYLDKILRISMLDREALRITNLSKRRAPRDKYVNFTAEEKAQFAKDIIEEINELPNPKVLVPLGNYPLEAITGKSGITNWRGSVLRPLSDIRHPCLVVPSYHPSSMHYEGNYSNWAYINADLSRVQLLMRNNFKFKFPEYNFIIQPSFKKVVEVVNWLVNDFKGVITIDLETHHDEISCIGLGWSREDAISIPFMWGGGRSYWEEQEELRMWKFLAEQLPKLKLSGQNVLFDWEVMYKNGFRLQIPQWDSMLMHACLWSEMLHRLEVLTSIYTDIPFYKKDEREEDTKRSTLRAGMEEDHWKYNCMDCVATVWCVEELLEELKEEDMLHVYKNLFDEMVDPILTMNLRGVKIDIENLEKARGEMQIELQAGEKTLLEIANEQVINYNSPKQVAHLLYDILKMSPYKTKSGSRATGEKILDALSYKYDSDAPAIIKDLRKKSKMMSLFSDDNIIDGRISCNYSLSTTVTGRLASQKSKITGRGMNLQNVKKSGIARQLFIPDDDFIMLGADQSQAEARLVSWWAEDEAMQSLFETDHIHLANARKILKREISKDEPIYTVMKSLIHGSNYGITAYGFARLANIPLADAKIYLEQYHETYPGIRGRFHKFVKERILDNRTLYNPFGRRQVFLGRIDDGLWKDAFAFLPQSTSSDITKHANKVLSKKYEVLLDLHDGLIIQCRKHKDAIEEGINDMREAFEIEFKIWGIPRMIPVDISIGESWGSLTEWN